MPEEYTSCRDALINEGYDEEDAQRICAIQYYQRHGETPEEAEEKLRLPEEEKLYLQQIRPEILESMKVVKSDDDEFVIYGPASVEIIDQENDLIKAEALKNALPQLLRRARISVEHTDTLVGEILPEYEQDGIKYKSEVKNGRLMIVANVWNDTEESKRTREKIKRGEYQSYSISGTALRNRTKQEEGEYYNEIEELDLHAITVCEEGMNQEANFELIAKMKKKMEEAIRDDDVRKALMQAIRKINQKQENENAEGDEDKMTKEEAEAEAKEPTKQEKDPEAEAKEEDKMDEEDYEEEEKQIENLGDALNWLDENAPDEVQNLIVDAVRGEEEKQEQAAEEEDTSEDYEDEDDEEKEEKTEKEEETETEEQETEKEEPSDDVDMDELAKGVVKQLEKQGYIEKGKTPRPGAGENVDDDIKKENEVEKKPEETTEILEDPDKLQKWMKKLTQ